jgi:hypothetical protein
MLREESEVEKVGQGAVHRAGLAELCGIIAVRPVGAAPGRSTRVHKRHGRARVRSSCRPRLPYSYRLVGIAAIRSGVEQMLTVERAVAHP